MTTAVVDCTNANGASARLHPVLLRSVGVAVANRLLCPFGLALLCVHVGCLAGCAIAITASDLSSERESCTFTVGARPEDTLGSAEPKGADIPIDHFVVVMQENRSFDHYFQMLPERGQPDVDVAPPDFSNPDPGGGISVHISHKTALCEPNPKHGWNSVHRQYAHGSMNGFVATTGDRGQEAMGYYDESELPYYYALAREFAIADRYFCDVLGPTFPNRLFAQSATAFGLTYDGRPSTPDDKANIYHQLDRAGVSWTIYSDGSTYAELLYPTLRSSSRSHFEGIQRFFDDAASGHLPAFAWVESLHTNAATASDEHPPGDVQVGEQFVARLIDAVIGSPDWPKAAVLLTYDEHGGYFDHVPPPTACAPDGLAPTLQPGDQPGRFNRLGMRVPLIAVSPFAKPHYVSHTVYSHVSILRLVQARFGLAALSARDANATPPFDMFDFKHAPLLRPPNLPQATVDVTELASCKRLYP